MIFKILLKMQNSGQAFKLITSRFYAECDKSKQKFNSSFLFSVTRIYSFKAIIISNFKLLRFNALDYHYPCL